MCQFEAKEKDLPLSMLCIDIDDFWRVNQKYSKRVGDLVLEHVIKIIDEELPENAVLAQVSAKELCVLLPERDMLSAKEVVRKIRATVQRNLFDSGDEKIPLTVSIGISSIIDSDEEILSLQVRADKALQKEKAHHENSNSTPNIH